MKGSLLLVEAQRAVVLKGGRELVMEQVAWLEKRGESVQRKGAKVL